MRFQSKVLSAILDDYVATQHYLSYRIAVVMSS